MTPCTTPFDRPFDTFGQDAAQDALRVRVSYVTVSSRATLEAGSAQLHIRSLPGLFKLCVNLGGLSRFALRL
jgi:hypothetical protein